MKPERVSAIKSLTFIEVEAIFMTFHGQMAVTMKE